MWNIKAAVEVNTVIIAETIAQVRAQVKEWKEQGLTVGLVPTMGYLHEGHASLVDKAVSMCDRVVASDFVNPTQFGPNEDLESYPRDFDRDCALLEEHGCSMVFHPSVEEMYAPDAATFVEILSDMPRQLCGKTRPIHFRGVCTVVSKLFNIVTPDKAFFGQKDAQQLAIIRRMVRDMSYGIEIVGCPIVREADGLAKSSRNTYLSAEERTAALVLSKAVFLGEKLVREGETDADKIVSAMKACIEAEKLAKIDYVSAVDAVTMESVHRIDRPVLVAMAVYIGKTRLIDNFLTEDCAK
jgi:pantoate--beta-alanine ligase